MNEKRKSRVSKLLGDVVGMATAELPADEENGEDTREKKPSPLDVRMQKLQPKDNKSQDYEMIPTRNVDPNRCRIREGHNRRYDLLDEDRCADLIDSFRSQGQQIPAIVRELHDDEEYWYEIIAGARRRWTALYLDIPLRVEIRTLTDKQAFELADAENRAREDISDFERAIEYKTALTNHYPSQKQMAASMEVSTSWLSRYLQIAELPDEIVSAYASILEIKSMHAEKLSPLLKDPAKRKSVLSVAVELTGQRLDGASVIKRLLAAGNTKQGRGGLIFDKAFVSDAGKELFHLKKSRRSGLTVVFPKEIPSDRAELEEALLEALRAHLQ